MTEADTALLIRVLHAEEDARSARWSDLSDIARCVAIARRIKAERPRTGFRPGPCGRLFLAQDKRAS